MLYDEWARLLTNVWNTGILLDVIPYHCYCNTSITSWITIHYWYDNRFSGSFIIEVSEFRPSIITFVFRPNNISIHSNKYYYVGVVRNEIAWFFSCNRGSKGSPPNFSVTNFICHEWPGGSKLTVHKWQEMGNFCMKSSKFQNSP